MKNFDTVKGKFLAVGYTEQYNEVKGKKILSKLANGLSQKVQEKELEVIGKYKANYNNDLSDKLGQDADNLGLNVGDLIFKLL